MPATLEHRQRVLAFQRKQERKMGLKYTVETVGDLRKVLATIPDDVPFQILCDGADYRKLEVQSLHDSERERFVKMQAIL